ncbi:MAG TPA: SMI1/KNR4 family protein [Clostridia bacterium]|nr:SMI1/KNR4 family protein [Clostridia bacterium]
MFLEHFISAREYLSQQGLKPTLVMGALVSKSDLNASDKETDFPMPPELRQFYLELGDGFGFLPNGEEDFKLVGWEHMHLADHRIWNKGFGAAIEEEAMREIGKPSTPDPELLKHEMARRKQWMPFYGFVGGGDVLCLDLNTSPPAVRFHEAQLWVALPQRWDLVLASSLTAFVRQWSRFQFLSPAGGWTSFCRERSGRFDWAPEHFPQINEKGA